jgi:hypothetical protein
MSESLWHIVVAIPARNEEELLPRCLDSVKRACARLPISVTWDIVVVADSSTDHTFEVSQALLENEGVTMRADFGVVGCARAFAIETALKRYAGPTRFCWLANTDADCCVPESWLLDQLALAVNGVEAIAGTVDVDCFAEHGIEVEDRFRASYLIHADGTHPHVHGANLGIRADTYLRVGGWYQLDTAEDHDLWNRLKSRGSLCVSVGKMKVITSGRRVGRAPLGFAGALAAHNEAIL